MKVKVILSEPSFTQEALVKVRAAKVGAVLSIVNAPVLVDVVAALPASSVASIEMSQLPSASPPAISTVYVNT